MANAQPFNEARADDLFGEPISVYTDAEAIEDGFIVDLGQFGRISFRGLSVNRMTRHLFDDLKPFADAEAPRFDGDFGKALASILRTKCRFAEGSPDNTGEIGDIWRIPPKLWLVRNEMGGWTAMYPEDY
jgi:hypothetical protein